jgi:predicted CopG family antitoxin
LPGYVTIAIQYEVRELLKELREDGESYNDIIKRLAEGKAKPQEAVEVDEGEVEETWVDENGVVWDTRTGKPIAEPKDGPGLPG